MINVHLKIAKVFKLETLCLGVSKDEWHNNPGELKVSIKCTDIKHVTLKVDIDLLLLLISPKLLLLPESALYKKKAFKFATKLHPCIFVSAIVNCKTWQLYAISSKADSSKLLGYSSLYAPITNVPRSKKTLDFFLR